jgi:hypothetical protein
MGAIALMASVFVFSAPAQAYGGGVTLSFGDPYSGAHVSIPIGHGRHYRHNRHYYDPYAHHRYYGYRHHYRPHAYHHPRAWRHHYRPYRHHWRHHRHHYPRHYYRHHRNWH